MRYSLIPACAGRTRPGTALAARTFDEQAKRFHRKIAGPVRSAIAAEIGHGIGHVLIGSVSMLKVEESKAVVTRQAARAQAPNHSVTSTSRRIRQK